VERDPPKPRLPDGIDDDEYKRLSRLMRASVLKTWRGRNEVIAGVDADDIVAEAWISMAENNFKSKGEFLPFALAVARNKAIDALRRVEARRRDRSLDELLVSEPETTVGADDDFFKSQSELDAVARLARFEEGLYEGDVLTDLQREIFVAARINGKSHAAVGRELDPPLTGQRVGQIVAESFIKLQRHVKSNEGMTGVKGGAAGGRR
jgi:RNA polymerase sigma factor (sigma-70 family)